MIFILLITIGCLSDVMNWIDFKTSFEYSWQDLQLATDYFIETQDEFIYFNFGSNVQKKCEGQSASAISFSKSGDVCRILGRHDIDFVQPFETSKEVGINLFYAGGSFCVDKESDWYGRKIVFRLVCKDVESEFWLVKEKKCATVLEKTGRSGCPKIHRVGFLTKLLLFS